MKATARQCWKGDTHIWDCLLTEASTPTINRDQHYLHVKRIYRKGWVIILVQLIFVVLQ